MDHVQVELGLGQFDLPEALAVKADLQCDPAFVKNVHMTISAGVRYAGREIDQTFGRYLINGTLADGDVAGGNGTPCRTPGRASDPGSIIRIRATAGPTFRSPRR